MNKILLYVLVFTFVATYAIEVDTSIQEQSTDKDFLIVKSTKSYKEAEDFANDIATRTNVKYISDKHYHKKLGLSQDKSLCEDANFEYPCYFSRGRYDDGVYVSIEYSTAYGGFAKGYYLVMIASGKYAKEVVNDVRKYVSDAYVKHSSVYLGCMH